MFDDDSSITLNEGRNEDVEWRERRCNNEMSQFAPHHHHEHHLLKRPSGDQD